MKLPTDMMESHIQIKRYTCIPSGVEFLLKQLAIEEPDFYMFQESWTGNSFSYFDNMKYKKLKFSCKFDQSKYPRGPSFPLDELFNTISAELNAGRYVLISLSNTGGWHIYAIYGEENGEFFAKSKADSLTIEENNVKAYVRCMGGTDILTYSYEE